MHSADQVDQQVAGDAGAVFLPAAPAREKQGIEGALGDGALPGVPVESLRGQIGGRRILPGTRGIVAAERAFDQVQVADRALARSVSFALA